MQAHPFIQPDYWLNHIGYMRQVLPLSEVYVCEVKGEIAGFIGLDGDYIAGLFVSKQYQSLGVGTTLIEFIKQQHFTLTLAVYKKNEKVMQFYRKQNFVVIEERIDSNTNEAELLMSWNRACPIL
jgi:GNAT superfamily N-acetyltransferase